MTTPLSPLDEVAAKGDRLGHLAREAGVAGIVLNSQANFSWLTAGRTNRIDGSREAGSGALMVAADGRRFAVANTIEAPRLAREALVDLGFDLIDYPWTDERADPAVPFRLAERAAGGPVASDISSPHAVALDSRITRLRAPLLPSEIDRYRDLGRDVGRVIGEVARGAVPGGSEQEVAARLAAALATINARPIVLLVAGDARIARYRHPTPTDTRWQRHLMVATCAERAGLVAAASRIVSAGSPGNDLSNRTRAAATVYGALLERTRTSTTGAQLFEAATFAYAAAGFPGEERLHHQGGAIGYQSRDWIAHPRSEEVVTAPQAFAWNPTITGTKIEETSIAHEDGRPEIVTSSPGWPEIRIEAGGAVVGLPDVLILQERA